MKNMENSIKEPRIFEFNNFILQLFSGSIVRFRTHSKKIQNIIKLYIDYYDDDINLASIQNRLISIINENIISKEIRNSYKIDRKNYSLTLNYDDIKVLTVKVKL